MKPYYEHGGITIYHGNCFAVLPILAAGSVAALITDAPYSSGGQFRGDRMAGTSAKYQTSKNRGTLPEFSGDNRDQRSFGYWCTLWLSECQRLLEIGAPVCLFTDWRQLPVTTDIIQAGGFIWRGIVPWNKTEASRPQKGRFRAQCEYVVWGSSGPMRDDGPALPGFFEKYMVPSRKEHIAEKPIEIMTDIVKICRPAGLVLDPFMGSGTTLTAAKALGLRAVGIELDEHTCEIAAKRLSQEVLPLGLSSDLDLP